MEALSAVKVSLRLELLIGVAARDEASAKDEAPAESRGSAPNGGYSSRG